MRRAPRSPTMSSAGGRGKVAFACGYGALYNHSYQPNADYYASGQRDSGVRRPSRHQSGRRDNGELQRQSQGPGEGRLCREVASSNGFTHPSRHSGESRNPGATGRGACRSPLDPGFRGAREWLGGNDG